MFIIKEFYFICTKPSLEEIITKECTLIGLISLIYNLMAARSNESAASKLDPWRADLNENISNDNWNIACKEAQTQTAMKKQPHQVNMALYIESGLPCESG